jgi:phosphoesterase RecJ-like protein
MKYQESTKLKELIQTAEKRVFINCHVSPDADSIGSALAMADLVAQLTTAPVDVMSPDEPPPTVKFLENYHKILIKDISTVDFSEYDLVILVDSSGLDRTGGITADTALPTTISVDHHPYNDIPAQLNLLDASSGSSAEIIYNLYKDLGLEVNQTVGEELMTGIAGDSSGFRNSGAKQSTFMVVAELMQLGVDKNKVIRELYGSLDLAGLRLLGELLRGFRVFEEYPVAYSSVGYEILQKYPDRSVLMTNNGTFSRSIAGTDLGIVFLEIAPQKVEVHIRSRADVDVSELARQLGGGGHIRAGGATIQGKTLEEVMEMTFELVKKIYAKPNLIGLRLV